MRVITLEAPAKQPLNTRLTYAMGAETIPDLDMAIQAGQDAAQEVAKWLRDQARLHPGVTVALLALADRIDAGHL